MKLIFALANTFVSSFVGNSKLPLTNGNDTDTTFVVVLPLYQNGLKQSIIRNVPLQGVKGVYTPTSPLRIQTPIKYTSKAGKSSSSRKSKKSTLLKKVRK